MGKREFLEMLGDRLSEELPRELVYSHLQYYESYIDEEARKGRKVSEIMEVLGDPIMIAHTIINTETGESFQGYAEDAVFTEIPKEESEQQQTVYEEKEVVYTHLHTENDKEAYAKVHEKSTDVEKRSFPTGCLIATVVAIVLVIGVLTIVGSLIGALLPILLPVILVFLLVSLLLGKRR